MILLLDTHALLWALSGSRRLSPRARDLVEDSRNTVLASVVSAWEISIKRALGRLAAPDDLEDVVEAAGFIKRDITFSDVRRLDALEDHHRDPFDRMLVAQAMVDGATLVSRDPVMARYRVPVVW